LPPHTETKDAHTKTPAASLLMTNSLFLKKQGEFSNRTLTRIQSSPIEKSMTDNWHYVNRAIGCRFSWISRILTTEARPPLIGSHSSTYVARGRPFKHYV